MKMPLGDQSLRQEDDHLTMSSDDTVQFTDIGSDAGYSGRNERIFTQPPVTINVFGAGSVTTGGSDTVPTAATTTISTGISGNSDSVISRLESQIAALSCKVEQLALQINSAQPQPRLQVDSGFWRTKRASTSQRVAFSKRFQSAPRVIVGISKADSDKNRNFRHNVYASDIDPEGFTVHADIWADTILFECGVSWVAIGDGKK
ncbi:hypothetical protein GGI43DRAFT_78954 [Trichoderma evansii]